LKGTAVDYRPTIWQHNHPIAKHIPADRLGGDIPGLWIPDSRPGLLRQWIVPRTGYNQNLPIVEKRRVDRVYRHSVWQRRPLPLHIRLRKSTYCREGDHERKTKVTFSHKDTKTLPIRSSPWEELAACDDPFRSPTRVVLCE
jgi:hypothetical protein